MLQRPKRPLGFAASVPFAVISMAAGLDWFNCYSSQSQPSIAGTLQKSNNAAYADAAVRLLSRLAGASSEMPNIRWTRDDSSGYIKFTFPACNSLGFPDQWGPRGWGWSDGGCSGILRAAPCGRVAKKLNQLFADHDITGSVSCYADIILATRGSSSRCTYSDVLAMRALHTGAIACNGGQLQSDGQCSTCGPGSEPTSDDSGSYTNYAPCKKRNM